MTNSLVAFIAPLVMLGADPAGAGGQSAALTDEHVTQAEGDTPKTVSSSRAPDWLELGAHYQVPIVQQVRIEQRVILRIVPRNTNRRNLVAELQSRRASPRYTQQKMGKCLKANSIVGVQANNNNRLLLFMRDQGMVLANLEKTCSSRDFYSGFYVERNDDGNLCIERDRLLSRSGAKCQLSQFRRLVPEGATR
ncbi:hypothetical protein ACRAQ7_11515 [Erythrobacter sp. W53]|uniref:hypothetical protein n=1 Tax=Erythrobacter sp. W53 TaxID=3425947 RepID=UPI003D769CEE